MKLSTVLGGFIAVLLAFAFLIWINNNLGKSSDPVQEDVSGVPTDGNQIFGANPFEDEYPVPPPRATLEESTHEFGRMPLGEERTHTFVVTNTGEGALKLAQGPSTCKCTVGVLGQDEVLPGDSAEIDLTWTPKSLDPAFYQTATIFTSDPESPELNLSVSGAVVPWATTFPSTWRTSVIKEDEPTPFEFVVVSQLAESFSITGVKPGSEFIDVGMDDVTPIPAEELEQYEMALSGYRITGQIAPDVPVGEISESIVVSTDIEQMAEIRLGIESSRLGPYQLLGPGWYGARKLLNLERFDAADGKQVRLSFFAQSARGDFQFTDVRIEPDVLDVTWKEDPDFENEARKRIYIDVVAPAGMTPGRWVREDPIHVTLLTNDPEVPEWDFFVTLQAN